MDYSKVGSIVINFLRPDTTKICIESLLQNAKGIRIYCGDQDGDLDLKKYCKSAGITYVKLRKDCGIGVARNKLVEIAITDGCDYFMWGDNDFVYDGNLNLNHTLEILEHNKDIGVVGGSLIEKGKLVHYERYMYYDKKRRILTFVPIDKCYPKKHMVNVYLPESDLTTLDPLVDIRIPYQLCDITFNFCVARKEVWKNKKIRWHNKIKVRFEHSYWFIMLQKHSKFKVAYCPSFQVVHKKFRTPEYDKFRNRDSDSLIYAKTLGIDAMFEVGEIAYDFTVLGQRLREQKERQHAKSDKTIFKINKTQMKEFENLLDNPPQNNKALQQFMSKDIDISDYIDEERLYKCFKELTDKDIKIVVLGDSCKSLINHGEFRVSTLTLGLDEKTMDSITIGKIAQNHNIKVAVLPWDSRTKIREWDGLDIHVPLPVIGYLEGLYGKDWDKK